MSGKTVKVYELCCKENNRLFSPFTWRTRLAALHKGLKVESVPWRFTEKDRLEFANSKTVPVIVDGDHAQNESWDIAVYLEKTYPDAPSLFGGKSNEAVIRFIDNYANATLMHYFPALVVDIWSKLDKADADYFREDREKMFSGKLEEVAKGGEEKVKKFREALEPVRMTLKSQKYIGGDSPNYGDYCIISVILTGRAVSKLQLLEKDDPVLEWFNRVLSNFGDLKDFIWEW